MCRFSEKLGHLPRVSVRDHLPLDIFGGWHLRTSPKKSSSAKHFVFKVYWSSFILPVKPNPIQKLILVSQSIDRDCTVWSSQWFINYEWRSSACMIDNLKSQLVTLTELTRKTGFKAVKSPALKGLNPIKRSKKSWVIWNCWCWQEKVIRSIHTRQKTISAGARKWADSYFPAEERVRLVRWMSHGEPPGEMSGDSTIGYS